MPFLTSLNAIPVLTGFQEKRDYLACSALQKEKIGPLWSLQQGAQKSDRSFYLFTFFCVDLIQI